MRKVHNTTLGRKGRALCLAGVLGAIGCTTVPLAHADGTVSVTTTKLQDFKGFGIYPAQYDRNPPTYVSGSVAEDQRSWLPTSGAASSGNLYDAFRDLSFDIFRTTIVPTIGKSDNTLDSTRMQDMKDHIKSFKNMGYEKYLISVWSPPAYMKLPDRVIYGKYNNNVQYLDPAYADGVGYDYADYLIAVLADLKASSYGLSAPIGISIANEPDHDNTDNIWCNWSINDTLRARYRTVVKQLKSKLQARAATDSWWSNIKIIGPEPMEVNTMNYWLGTPSSSGWSEMNSDTGFRDALDGFAFHTYGTTGDTKNVVAAMLAYPTKDRWQTEVTSDTVRREDWGQPGYSLTPYDSSQNFSGNVHLNWALNWFRRMGGDLVDLRVNYWFSWLGWRKVVSCGTNEDLIHGENKDTAVKNKSYYAFQKLYQIVGSGWKVMQTTDTDSDLRSDNSAYINGTGEAFWSQSSAPVDIIAFQSGDDTKSCVVLVNWTTGSKNITGLSGLKGSGATIYRTSGTENMAEVGTRSVSSGSLQGGNLTLPSYSITILSTGGGTGTTLANGSFENPLLSANAFSYNSSGGSWSFSNNSGIVRNGSGFGNVNAPEGSQAAFLQTNSSAGNGLNGVITQNVTLSAGTYTLSFQTARRHSQTQQIKVSVGTTVVKTVAPSSSSYELVTSDSFNVEAGSHTIKFEATVAPGSGDYTAFIDDVKINSGTLTVGTGTGLKGEYYSGNAFNTFIKSQTDPTINFTWSQNATNTDGTSMSSVGPDNFSVRWTGRVQAVEGGNYTFSVVADDGMKVWLSDTTGTPIINQTGYSNLTPTNSSAINLTAGQKYDIKVEFREDTGGAMAKLYWTRPGGTSVIIPQSQLYPPTTTTAPTLANSGFESPATTNYIYNPSSAGWAFSGVGGDGSGIQKNGGAWGAATAPGGTQTAFLQRSGSISQSVNFTSTGSYSLVYKAAQRSGNSQGIKLTVGSTVVETFTPTGTSFASHTSPAFTISATGNTLLKLEGTVTGTDSTAFVDDVVLVKN